MRNLSVELRPKTFTDFIGAESVINPILEGIKQGRIDSAYMFSGAKGSGKTSLARVLAKYVQGEELPEYDIEEINTANCNTADDARELVQRARYNPWVGKYKVFILDEAQRMTPAAQQIMLKDLEEPCASLIWMPCTSEPGKIDAALRRRCGDWRLRGLYPDEVGQLILKSIRKLDSAVEKKYPFSKCEELVKALNDNNVTSPGFIIRALEKFITGVPAGEAAQVSEVTSVDTLAVCREAVKGNWSAVQKLLQKASLDDGRGIRAAVAGYFRSILLKSDTDKRSAIAVAAIHELIDHSTFEEGLQLSATVASLYKVCKLIKS